MKFNLKLTAFLAIAFCLISGSGWAETYYIRTNGGTGTQCNGTANQDYPGSGSNQNCAFNHPHWVMPMETNSTVSETFTNSNGDTIVIVNGSYRIGCQNTTNCLDATHNVQNGDCNSSASYDCDPRPLVNNVTIVGCSTTGCGCTYGWGGVVSCTTTRPELWGSGNVQEVIDASGSINVTLKDIEITDHANCNTFTPFTCTHPTNGQSYPQQLAAQLGINATSATNLTLTGVNLHGVGYEGMRVKNVNRMTITGSNIDYTAVGMNSDDSSSCTNCGLSGAITISKSSMNGNGCIEDWQNDGSIVANTCCSQSQGCSSAEAINMSNTGGNWVITDSDTSYNTADGIDLLYLNRGTYSGGSLTVKRTRSEGNAGNAIKGPNAMYVLSSYPLGNCGFFQGLNRTFDSDTFDHCRSNTGNPIAIEWRSGDSSTPMLFNNTISSNGDLIIGTSEACTTGIDVIAQGNIFIGGYQFNDDSSNPLFPAGGDGLTDIYFDAGTDGEGAGCNSDFVEDYNAFIGQFKNGDPRTGSHSIYNTSYSTVFTGTLKEGPYSSPGYFGSINYHLQMKLKSGSLALGLSNEVGSDAIDFNSFARGSSWDGGAVEFGSTGEVLCGNGAIDSGEQCDGALLNSQTCQTNGYDEGTLGCTSGCVYDFSGCNDFCGNGTIESPEECDGSNLNSNTCVTEGFESGTISCNGCQLNTSACFTDPCGNGTIQSPEECDGTNLNGNTCQTEGFTYGTATCLVDCTLNTSGCSNPSCGNGIVESGEQCDGAALNSKTCTTQGFDSGTLACNGNCTFNTSSCAFNCGNGTIQTGEACDGANLNSKTCVTQGFDSGTLSCNSTCTLNTSGCVNNFCGDGAIGDAESCDGAALNSQTCVTQGFTSGTLACLSNCTFNTSGCVTVTPAVCGNGVIEGNEVCDTTALNSQTCVTQGFVSGSLSCSSNCAFNTSLCSNAVCGNGIIDSGESCDGSALNSATCVTQGFDSGTLTCNNLCAFNTSACAYTQNTNSKMIIGGKVAAGGVGSIQ